ncbi:MAG: DUF423 domain-containing protein [Balneolaceae bacterium]|nr:DUF423 domain-containing protein [Balneolaceae bacterium]
MFYSNNFLQLGATFMALAVAFGAFGAHIVEGLLTLDRFEVYQTAVQYHFYHALGLLIIGAVSFHISNKWMKWSGYSMVFGILIFSGSLYLLTLLDIGWLGAVTPIGGFAFILAWVFLLIGVLKNP